MTPRPAPPARPPGAARLDSMDPTSSRPFSSAPSGGENGPPQGALRRYLRAAGGVLPLVWLVYLFNVPLVLFFMRAPGWLWWASAGVVALFLASYLRMLVARSDREVALHGALQWGLAAAAVPWSPGCNVLFIYAAGGLGHLSRPRVAVGSVAAVELGVVLHGLAAWRWLGWGPAELASVYLPALVFVVVIGAVNVVSAQRRRADRLLRVAREEVERLAAVAERERIARDLHDLLGHTLSVIRIKAELAARLAERDPPRAAHEMREVETTARDALREVRTAVRGYRAHGLDGEIASAKIALEGAGVAFRYDRTLDGTLPAEVEGVLALVVREAVTNVLRHAGASRCAVELAPAGPGAARLEVRDNGRGALRGRAEDATAAPEGSGLRGIGERLRSLGGTLKTSGIDPEDEATVERGFALRARVPIASGGTGSSARDATPSPAARIRRSPETTEATS